jgi:S-DNA-T family DNA segregation ATPase FtsK/SpoIIIE
MRVAEEDPGEVAPSFLERLSEPAYQAQTSSPEADGPAEEIVGAEQFVAEAPIAEEPVVAEGAPAAPEGGKVIWKLPAPTLLKRSVSRSLDKDELWRRGKVLSEALATHKVETSLVGMTVGPTVTRYELELGSGVKVARVTSLHKDIAYAMAAADVRILAPIPGRSAIGVEVPNHKRVVVALADVLLSPEADANQHPLAVAAGRDISGKPVLINLSEMPHILIAGATGSGKSSCLSSILTSILMRSTPEQVRLILVDPKRVELGQYNGVPHLLTPVVTNPKKAANALAWAVKEMERRYDMLSELGARDIYGYNQIIENMGAVDLPAELAGEVEVESGPAPLFDETPELRYSRLPFILVVVDELNDLMMVAARDVEESICRIAQMARAVGIHLVIATQRPSVDVITGLIKANIPSRMAFSVSSLADSRVILDQPGAERLVGKGDMLFLGASSSHPQRIQAPWVSEEEVRKVVGSWVRQGKASYLGEFNSSETPAEVETQPEEEDELFQAAMELVVNSQLGSTSMLQRKLKVGFSRAGRLMDLLERHGVVGPLEGSKPRVVLMSKEELENYLEAHG